MKKIISYLIIVILVFIIVQNTISDTKHNASDIQGTSSIINNEPSQKNVFSNDDVEFYNKEMASIDDSINNLYMIKKENNVLQYGIGSIKNLDYNCMNQLLISIDSGILTEANEYISNKDCFLFAIYAQSNLVDYTFNHFFIGKSGDNLYISFYNSFKEQKFYYIDSQTFSKIESLFKTLNSTSIYTCEQSFKKCIAKDTITSDNSIIYEYTDNKCRYEYSCNDIYPYSDFLPAYKISYFVYTDDGGNLEKTYSYTYGINMITGEIITGF